ncbi:MAG: YihY/virulence factor BrkB family protein [Acidisphaera sp.]|nr:YihY/virulence factor BrkB family protein [Acidisphaera sp.]
MAIRFWPLLKRTASDYIADDCLSRGAAIAYYTIFSIAPVLVIAIAVAGLAFGADAARGAIADQLSGLMGKESADALNSMVRSAANRSAGTLATIVGLVTLLITATGVFTEMQSALNAIWKAEPTGTTVGRLVRVRLASLGLVMSLGFLLLVSLVVSAGLTALGTWLKAFLPGTQFLLQGLNFVISFLLITLLFAAIYKVLPDKPLTWRDVGMGAVATAFLFTVGKFLISLYIGSSQVASSYGAAGALMVTLLWIYYSAQIFLLGAEFTKAFAERHGSKADPGARTVDSTKDPEAAKDATRPQGAVVGG